MVEVSLTVGKLDASLALLLTKDHHLIEFPTILLPNGVRAGSIVKISCERDLETEAEEQRKFLAVQDEILATFGKNLPKAPLLKVKNVTQTSCVLEWDPLDLGTASLKSLTLFKDGKKLGAIPLPLNNRTTKLSGLAIEKSFKFQLKLDSTAGVYTSDIIEVTTHKMTDLSGIQVCLGDITPNDQFTVDDIQQTLVNMGAHHPALDKMKVETTHFVTTRENKQNAEFIKANEMNIPIIRPEWLKACEKERRIVGVRDFYVKDCVLPDIFAKNYWLKPASSEVKIPDTAAKEKPPVPDKEVATETETAHVVPAVEISAPSEEKQEGEATQHKSTEVKKDDSEPKEQEQESEDLAKDVGETEKEAAKEVKSSDASPVEKPQEENVSVFKKEAVEAENKPIELVKSEQEPVEAPKKEDLSEESDITEVATENVNAEEDVGDVDVKEESEKVDVKEEAENVDVKKYVEKVGLKKETEKSNVKEETKKANVKEEASSKKQESKAKPVDDGKSVSEPEKVEQELSTQPSEDSKTGSLDDVSL